MVDKEVLSRKLSQLRQYVTELNAAQDITLSVYQNDIRAKAFVERYLHLAIESVIDIANHLISFTAGANLRGTEMCLPYCVKTASFPCRIFQYISR